jgi:predicted nuclease of predicted toxin-antitoxin system
MRIKLDENLPSRLAPRLAALGQDVRTVGEEGIAGHVDAVISEAAQREARFLVTQDMDFSDTRRFTPGSHCGILLVRLRTPSRRALIKRVEGLFREEDVSRWPRCFIVATERKVRVRHPR